MRTAVTGGFRRQWATQPIHTFVEALEAFRTAVEFRFVRWLNTHIDVFAAHKAKFGYIWAQDRFKVPLGSVAVIHIC